MDEQKITVYEKHEQRGNDVIRLWSFDCKHWNEELTAYSNPPFVVWGNYDGEVFEITQQALR